MPATDRSASPRALYLDLFKTLLVWGMISAHVIQLLGFRLGAGADNFSTYINLISFSGYMLAFGLGIGLSRGKRRAVLWDRARPVLILLAAVYVSSIAFTVLVDRKPLTPDLLLDLFTFRRLFGYSEFLASFFVLYVIIAIARPLLVAIAERPLLLVLAIVLCLASTYLVTDQLIPFSGTLIGNRNYATFPLLAYLPWFLVGIRLGRRDGVPAPIDMALALAGTGYFLWAFWRMGFFALPERFPPSIAWVVAPAAVLLIYLVAARALTDWVKLPSLLLAPGRHVLAALLFSNLAIFIADHFLFKPARPLWMAALISLGLLVVVTLWCAGLDRLKARRA
jgi:hypothetical protein